MGELATWIALVCFIIAAGFYSGIETGFYVLSRFRLEILAARGRSAARRIARLARDHDKLLITCLIGTNLCSQLATECCYSLLGEIEPAAQREILATLLLTPALFFFGEVLPKDLFRARAERMVYRSGALIDLSRVLFLPATLVLRASANAMANILRVRDPQRRRYRGREGLEELVRDGFESGLLSDQQVAIAHNVLRLQNRPIRAVMRPLEEVAWIERGADLEAVLQLGAQHPHTRFPVLAEGRPVGYVNIGDALRAPAGATLDDLIRWAASFSPELPVSEALGRLRGVAGAFAFVVGEGNLLEGILSPKDLLEEIVGEFADL